MQLKLSDDGPPQDKVIESFKTDFEKIKGKEFISLRRGDTGIGKTFEEIMNIPENNSKMADYEGILEIKSKREFSQSMLTLTTKSPSHPKKVNSIIREKYGRPDANFGSVKVVHTTIKATDFNSFDEKYGFKLDVDDSMKKIYIVIKNIINNQIEPKEIYYSFDDIKEIIETKLKYIAFIDAKSEKMNGKEKFTFKSAILLYGLTLDKFIEGIKKGYILYDIRLGAYGKGCKNEGKPHDHGSGFRIKRIDIPRIFTVTEI